MFPEGASGRRVGTVGVCACVYRRPRFDVNVLRKADGDAAGACCVFARVIERPILQNRNSALRELE